MAWAPITPELLVLDFDSSLSFWTDVLGFDVLFTRADPDFAMLGLGRAQVMLEALHESAWVTAELARPLGRGINLEIEHPDPSALAQRLTDREILPFQPLRETKYVMNGSVITQQEVLVQDPDGYLLRFAREIEPLDATPGAT